MKLVGKMKKKGEKTFFANFTSYKSPTNIVEKKESN